MSGEDEALPWLSRSVLCGSWHSRKALALSAALGSEWTELVWKREDAGLAVS